MKTKVLLLYMLLIPVLTKVENRKRPISVLLVNGLYTGHLFPLVSLGEELVRRGHSVTLIANVLNGSSIYPDFPERVGIKFISAGYDQYWTKASVDKCHEDLAKGKFDSHKIVNMVHTSILQIRDKIESIGMDEFDIIICDAGIQPVGIFFHVLGKKAVIFNPLLTMFQPSLDWPYPATSSGQSDDLSFVERFFNAVLFEPLISYMYRLLFTSILQVSKRYKEVLSGHIDFLSYTGTQIPMIVTSVPGLEYSKSRLPLVEYVGPVLFHTPPELSSDLKQWLDGKSPKSVIYVSMGTTATLPPKYIEAIFKGIFVSTSYSVVWVIKVKDRDVLQNLGTDQYTSRLYVADWVAQQSLLRHVAISISIVHCGLNSVHESIFNSHPVICFPGVFDQFEVATRVVSAGVGVSMYGLMEHVFGNVMMTPQMVEDAIHAVAADDYCSRNISKVRKTFVLAGGAKRAAELVEFYEDVGYDHLVPAYVKYQWSWIQYYNCDVWLVLMVALTLLLFSCWMLLKASWKYLHYVLWYRH